MQIIRLLFLRRVTRLSHPLTLLRRLHIDALLYQAQVLLAVLIHYHALLQHGGLAILRDCEWICSETSGLEVGLAVAYRVFNLFEYALVSALVGLASAEYRVLALKGAIVLLVLADYRGKASNVVLIVVHCDICPFKLAEDVAIFFGIVENGFILLFEDYGFGLGHVLRLRIRQLWLVGRVHLAWLLKDAELPFCSLDFFLILLQIDPPNNIYDPLLQPAVSLLNLAITNKAARVASLSHVPLPVNLIEEEYLFEEHGPLLQGGQGVVEVDAVVLELGIAVGDGVTVFLVLLLEPSVLFVAHGLKSPPNFQVESAHGTRLLLISLRQFLLVEQY